MLRLRAVSRSSFISSWLSFDMFTLLLASLLASSSTPLGFIDDYDLALERAKAEKKYIIADFSGSDWCFWCQRLDKEIFAKEEFISVATNKYVLLMVDSPRDKSVLSEKARLQNPNLKRRYKISQYPTVLILDENGKLLGETGFLGGGPENYLKHLEEKIAEIPYFLEWIKPLDRRVADFLREMNKGCQKRIEASSKREALLYYADKLKAIHAEEALKIAPETIRPLRLKRLEEITDTERQIRETALSCSN